jgi:2-oxoglutarate ferredoxin oxidoreductase subunit delta
MALLTKKEMKRTPIVDDASESQFGVVEIELEKCTGCNLCTLICPANVLEMFGEKGDRRARVKDGLVLCLACDNCHASCEGDAITVVKGYDFVGRYKKLDHGAPTQPRRKY